MTGYKMVSLSPADQELICAALNYQASARIGNAGMMSNERRREALKEVAAFDDLADRIRYDHGDHGGTVDDAGAAAFDLSQAPDHGF